MDPLRATGASGRDLRTSSVRPRRILPILGICVLTLAVIAAGLGFVMDAMYKDKALPESTLAGTPIEGMTSSQIASVITDMEPNLGVTISINGKEAHASADDLGASIDSKATIDQVTSGTERTWWIYRSSDSRDYPLVLTLSETATQEWVSTSFPDAGAAPVNAAIAFNGDTGLYDVTPSAPGKGLTMGEINQIRDALSANASSAEVTVTLEDIPATVTDEAAATARDWANARVAAPFTLTYNDEVVYTLNPADIANLLTMTSNDGESATVVADATKIETLLTDTVAPQVNIAAVEEQVYVDSGGNTVSTTTAGVDGRTLSDIPATAQAIATALNDNSKASAKVTFDTVAHTTKTLPQPSPLGPHTGHWADVNLTTQTVTLMDGDTPVVTFSVSTGAAGHETPIGTYKVYSKVPTQSVRGCVDGDCHDYSNVKWCTWFFSGRGGIGFYTAYWHDDFGRAVSHECVNMREDEAKQTYDWLLNGSTVIVHN